MTDEELKQLVASLAVAHQESTRKLDRLSELVGKNQIAQHESTRKLDRLGELVGNISNNQGDIAEELFYQSFIKNPTLGDIKFDAVSRNLNNHLGNLQEEYDLVLINGDSLAVIEVKAKAHISDLERMINRKMVNFPKLFSVYRNFHTYAGIATLVTNDELIEKAQELGLFLITQQGDHTAIVQTGRLLH